MDSNGGPSQLVTRLRQQQQQQQREEREEREEGASLERPFKGSEPSRSGVLPRSIIHARIGPILTAAIGSRGGCAEGLVLSEGGFSVLPYSRV